MTIFLNVLFAIELALLLTHEMDAVRHKEWQMFIGLKDLPEGTAYWLFTLPHIILYTLIIVFLLYESSQQSAHQLLVQADYSFGWNYRGGAFSFTQYSLIFSKIRLKSYSPSILCNV